MSNSDINFKENIPFSLNWNQYFLTLCVVTSLKSKDPSTKTGAVIVDRDNRIVSTGYNGFIAGVEFPEEYWTNRDLKYSNIIHAEMNAVLGASKIGRSVNNCICYVNLMPCSNCAKHLLSAGIKKVVTLPTPDFMKERWQSSFDETEALFEKAGAVLEVIDFNTCGIPRFLNGSFI